MVRRPPFRDSFRWLGVGKCALVAGAALLAWNCTVRPLEERAARLEREDGELGERIEAARRSFKEVQALEQQSISVARELAELNRDHPAGSALVWLPMRVKEQFQRFKCVDPRVRMEGVREVHDLPGYTRIAWEIELPVQRTPHDIRNALAAILGIEEADPFVRVQDVGIGPDPADSSRDLAVANIALLAPRP